MGLKIPNLEARLGSGVRFEKDNSYKDKYKSLPLRLNPESSNEVREVWEAPDLKEFYKMAKHGHEYLADLYNASKE